MVTTLNKNTLLVKDGETYIVYSPFQGKIARIKKFPTEGSSLEHTLKENGFFGEIPERTKQDKVGEWTGFHSLTLLLTRQCNLGCTYCYAKAKADGPSMSLDLALGSIEWFINHTIESILRVTFHGGGEPTLEQTTIKATVARVEELKGERRTKYFITTNGTTPRTFMEWMMNNQFRISISVDGPPEIQNRNRPFIDGGASSKIVEENIRFLVSQTYPFTVRITYSAVDDIVSIIRYFGDLGVKSLHLEPLFPYGRDYDTVEFGQESQYNIYSPVAAELVKSFLVAMDICKEYKIKIYNSHLVHFTKGVGYFCGAASGRSMIVGHDGILTACLEVVDAQDKDAPIFTLGHWIPERRDFFINKEKLAMLQNRHADTMEECKTCYARYHCAGGCAVKAVRATGKFSDRDIPYCGYTRALVPILVKRIAKTSGV